MKKLNIISSLLLLAALALITSCEKEEPINLETQTDNISIKKPGKVMTSEAGVSYLKYGPAGGNGGMEFDDPMTIEPGESWRQIVKIQVWSGWWVDAIKIDWKDSNGNYHEGTKRGGDGGTLTTKQLQDGEFIIKAEVSYGWYVNGLKFTTNQDNTYTFGEMKLGLFDVIEEFDFSTNEQSCHGFFGKADWYLDQIGFYGYDDTLLTGGE